MKKRSLTSDGKYIDHANGLGTVTKDMVSQRAHEIALINRRADNKPTTDDWAEAKRELTTARGLGNDPAEELGIEKRWDPVPGSHGMKADNMGPEDEQTVAETLVQEGVEEAEHEQMVEGTRESVERDRALGDSGTSR
jgi:hypothetical protein